MNKSTATPWDALLAPAGIHARSQVPTPTAAAQARPDSKLAIVLAEIGRHHCISTADLAKAASMPTKTIWGLLRLPRDRGQVAFADGKWALVHDYCGTDVMRAAELLRSKGWRVEKPAALNTGGNRP